jgi:hypothetical protein
MTSRDFAFWLQGFFEVANPSTIGSKETELIKKHLALVFKHEIDPSMGDQEHQDGLNLIHHSSKPPGFPSSYLDTDKDGIMRC